MIAAAASWSRGGRYAHVDLSVPTEDRPIIATASRTRIWKILSANSSPADRQGESTEKVARPPKRIDRG